MKQIQLCNLRSLARDMQQKNEKLALFSFDYWSRRFSAVLLVDREMRRLFITLIGSELITVEFDFNEEFCVPTFIDERSYERLIALLGIQKKRDGLFRPSEFFKTLDKAAPDHFSPALRHSYLNITPHTSMDNSEAPYFVGFRRSPSGRCTKKNMKRTRESFPAPLAELAISHGISSCWSKNKNRAKQILINDLLSKIN